MVAVSAPVIPDLSGAGGLPRLEGLAFAQGRNAEGAGVSLIRAGSDRGGEQEQHRL